MNQSEMALLTVGRWQKERNRREGQRRSERKRAEITLLRGLQFFVKKWSYVILTSHLIFTALKDGCQSHVMGAGGAG